MPCKLLSQSYFIFGLQTPDSHPREAPVQVVADCLAPNIPQAIAGLWMLSKATAGLATYALRVALVMQLGWTGFKEIMGHGL